SAETTIRLAADVDNIVATKEASGDFDQFGKIMRDKPADFLLISGDDPATLPMLSLGAVGVISVVGNAFPTEVAKLARLCNEGSYVEARNVRSRLIRMIELCVAEGNAGRVKAILHQVGICGPTVRLPLVVVRDRLETAVRAELETMRTAFG